MEVPKFPNGFFETIAVLAIIGAIALVIGGWLLIVKTACWLYVHYN